MNLARRSEQADRVTREACLQYHLLSLPKRLLPCELPQARPSRPFPEWEWGPAPGGCTRPLAVALTGILPRPLQAVI